MRAYAFLDTLIEPAEREPRRAPQGFTCTPTTSKQYLFGVLADTGLLGGWGIASGAFCGIRAVGRNLGPRSVGGSFGEWAGDF